MLELDEISKALQGQRLSAVSAVTGLSFPTLQRLKRGGDQNYNLDTIRAISEYVKSGQVHSA